MVKRTVVLPRKDNDGRSLRSQLASVETDMRNIAGGFTRSPATGEWADSGRIYRDSNYAYWLTVDASADAELVAAMPDWAKLLRQEALYTDASQVDVQFVSAA